MEKFSLPSGFFKMMLDQPGIKEACESVTATFLEMIMAQSKQFNRVKKPRYSSFYWKVEELYQGFF